MSLITLYDATSRSDLARASADVDAALDRYAPLQTSLFSHPDRKLPTLPRQGVGPHVEIQSEGVIGYPPPEALDREGNYLPRLRALHPDICELAQALVAQLCGGNKTYSTLADRIEAYNTIVSRELQDIDFRRLYVAGVRLANAARATDLAISDGELPKFDEREHEEITSLLDLHGTFILASAAGAEAVDQERYQNRPEDEARYRKDAIAVADTLQDRPDLCDPEVAREVLGVAQDIGRGIHPERSTVAGRSMVQNMMIALAGGAIGGMVFSYGGLVVIGVGAAATWLGGLAVNETIKQTHWFKSLTKSMASRLDKAAGSTSKDAADRFVSGLRRHSQYFSKNEAVLRQLASGREELAFLDQSLNLVKENVGEAPKDEE